MSGKPSLDRGFARFSPQFDKAQMGIAETLRQFEHGAEPESPHA